jgi:hypothetical protein
VRPVPVRCVLSVRGVPWVVCVRSGLGACGVGVSGVLGGVGGYGCCCVGGGVLGPSWCFSPAPAWSSAAWPCARRLLALSTSSRARRPASSFGEATCRQGLRGGSREARRARAPRLRSRSSPRARRSRTRSTTTRTRPSSRRRRRSGRASRGRVSVSVPRAPAAPWPASWATSPTSRASTSRVTATTRCRAAPPADLARGAATTRTAATRWGRWRVGGVVRRPASASAPSLRSVPPISAPTCARHACRAQAGTCCRRTWSW